MKLLFLAPEPFFQERGTPIAARLALDVLARRAASQQNTGSGERIDFLTYNDGEDISLPGIHHFRTASPAFLKGVGPGISVKKLLCDVFFVVSVLQLLWKNRKDQYDLIHAIEESAFIALFVKVFFSIPYIYDMDSSLSMQLVEKWPLLKPLSPVLSLLEKAVVRNSIAVVPVCDALAAIADGHGSPFTSILRDISLLKDQHNGQSMNLRGEIGATPDNLLIVYIGNLEPYQGIDLLLESFALTATQDLTSLLVIIGGRDEHIEFYRGKAASLGVAQRVFLLGPRPVGSLDQYIYAADILASPRVRGNNTPMKIYTYLHAGRAILATDLPTHSQVLNSEVAELRKPDPQDFSLGLLELVRDPDKRTHLGSSARAMAQERYTFEVFSKQLNQIYDRVSSSLQR